MFRTLRSKALFLQYENKNEGLVKNDVRVVVAYIIFLPVTLAEADKTTSDVTYNTKVPK